MDKMTALQKIRKAKTVYGWITPVDSYIQVTKQSASLIAKQLNNDDINDQFVLRENGNLYIG